MKRLSLFASALILMVSCTQVVDVSSKEQDEVAKQSIEVVKKMIQATETEDINALKEVYSVDLESVGPRHGQVWPYDSIIQSSARWFEYVDSINFSVDYIMFEKVEEGELAGDWVLLWADISWYDVKSQKSFIVDLHSPSQIVDGKIVYEHSYWNQWDLYKQMGAKIKWPEKDQE